MASSFAAARDEQMVHTTSDRQGAVKQEQEIKPAPDNLMGPPPRPVMTPPSKLARRIVDANRAREREGGASSCVAVARSPHKPPYQQRVNTIVRNAQHPSKTRPSTFSKAHCQDTLREHGPAGIVRSVTNTGQQAFGQMRGDFDPVISDWRHGTAAIFRDPDYREMCETAKRIKAKREVVPSQNAKTVAAETPLPSSVLPDGALLRTNFDMNDLFDFDAAAEDGLLASEGQNQNQDQQRGSSNGVNATTVPGDCRAAASSEEMQLFSVDDVPKLQVPDD